MIVEVWDLCLLLIGTYLLATWLPYAILRVTNHIENKREYRKFISRSWQIAVLPFHLLIFVLLTHTTLNISPETVRFICGLTGVQGCIYSLTTLWQKMHLDRLKIQFGDKSIELEDNDIPNKLKKQ